MLTNEQINQNKERFLQLLEPAVVSRERADWNKLHDKLENSDFFTAPASTKFHLSCKGGLCQHSLNVYDNLMFLVKEKHLEDTIKEDTIAIVALLHDFAKMNFYKMSAKNVKVYSPNGLKYDELGRFDWEAQMVYTVIPDEEKTFMLGTHEENSAYMVEYFIPLTVEEHAAILNHHGGMGYDSMRQNQAPKIMTRYYLAALLHIADMLATYVDEVEHE